MRTTHWLMTAIVGLLLTGCAGTSTAPTAEARQALAPTGKLRVALQLGNALNVTRDSASGEMKGLGHDLGKELARRIGVPFEPVLYPSIGAILDSGKSGAWDVGAALIRAPSNPGALEAVKSGRADVMGSIKPILFDLSNQMPGSRVLDGRPGIDPHAMAMPRGRDPGMAYLRRFMEEAKAEGLVKAAIDRAGLRGVVVAGPAGR
jgi:ABC-type amino acid transport substrate-binding protein